MIRKTISMPEAMGKSIEKRVKAGQYGNDSEYIRDLVRKDLQRERGREKFRRAVDDGLASGVSERSVEEIFEAAVSPQPKRKKRA